MNTPKIVKTTLTKDDTFHPSQKDFHKSRSKTRSRFKLSEGLSPEGRQAMKLTLAEAEESKKKVGFRTPADIARDSIKVNRVQLEVPKEKRVFVRQKSFSDVYERSASSRLNDDITSKDYTAPINKSKRALDGGSLFNTMETVEIVKHGETESSDAVVDDVDTAHMNSVEKCLVWMEVNGLTDEN